MTLKFIVKSFEFFFFDSFWPSKDSELTKPPCVSFLLSSSISLLMPDKNSLPSNQGLVNALRLAKRKTLWVCNYIYKLFDQIIVPQPHGRSFDPPWTTFWLNGALHVQCTGIDYEGYRTFGRRGACCRRVTDLPVCSSFSRLSHLWANISLSNAGPGWSIKYSKNFYGLSPAYENASWTQRRMSC